MLIEYRDQTPFDRGWKPPADYDPAKLFYDQSAYADFRAFEGFAFKSPDYSFWKDAGRFREVQRQMGPFRALLDALDVRVALSVGSGRPIWEVLISAQAPDVKFVASDINVPQNIHDDLRQGKRHGYPTAENISYITLDVRDTKSTREVLCTHHVDTLFICSCFFVASDEIWFRFLGAARDCGVRNVILLHSEAISPLNLVRYSLLKTNRTGVLMGYLRSTSAVVDLFETAGYRYRISYVPTQYQSLGRKVLARLHIHYSRRSYVFSLGELNRQVNSCLKLATPC